MTIRVADQVCVGHFWERGRPWGAEGTGETEGGSLWIGERPRVPSRAGRAVPRAPKHTRVQSAPHSDPGAQECAHPPYTRHT